MKFLCGLLAGILLCILLFGAGGYYLLKKAGSLPVGATETYSSETANNSDDKALKKALSDFNKANSSEDMLKSLDKIIALRPNEAQAYAAKAALLVQKGDYKQALTNYDKAIALQPDSADLYLDRASLLLMLGDYKAANADLSKAIAINPNLAEAYYNRGVSNINLQRVQPAVADFKQAQKLFASAGDRNNYSQASYALNLLKMQGASNAPKNRVAAKAKLAKAAAELKTSLPVQQADNKTTTQFKKELTKSLSDASSSFDKADKKNMVEKFKKVSAGLNSGEVDLGDFNAFAASAQAKTSARNNSAEKTTLDYLSDAKSKMAKGDYEGAIADYDKAIGNTSNPSDLYTQRAAANLQNKNYQAAYSDYTKAIEADKNNASAYLNRARLRASLGDNKGAAQDAKAAADLYKQQGNQEGALQAQNMANLAQGNSQQLRSKKDSVAEALFKDASNAYAGGNYRESLNKFNELAARQPNVPEVYYNRAIANAALGDKDAALKDYQKAISLNPNLPDAHIGAASMLLEQGKTAQAAKEIDAALKLNPNIPSAYRMRGAQSLQEGNPQKAVEDFTKAIDLDDSDPASYLSRGLGYAQQGGFDKAGEDFERAAALASQQGNQNLLGEISKYQQALQEAQNQAAQGNGQRAR